MYLSLIVKLVEVHLPLKSFILDVFQHYIGTSVEWIESNAGVSIKAGYWRSTAACKVSYCRLFVFH